MLRFPGGRTRQVPVDIPVILGRADLLASQKAVNISRSQCEISLSGAASGGFNAEILSKGQNPTLIIRNALDKSTRVLLLRGQRARIHFGDQFALHCAADPSEFISFDTSPEGTAGIAPNSERVCAEAGADAFVRDATGRDEAGDDGGLQLLKKARTQQDSPLASGMESAPTPSGENTLGGDEASIVPNDAAMSGDDVSPTCLDPASAPSAGTTAVPVNDLGTSRVPHLVILCGPPGAGKSTLCGRLPEDRWVRVNQDSVAKGRPGSRKQCLNAMRAALEARRHVVVDRCNMTNDQRKDFLQLGSRYGCSKEAVVLQTPMAECERRISARIGHEGGVEGEASCHLARQQASAWEAPSAKEGFERVSLCRQDSDIDDVLNRLRDMAPVSASC
ncbi:hypothetical protein CYMTET_35928, partial [Cymbomonas tetramitiformis]